jgi:hypothetical protein
MTKYFRCTILTCYCLFLISCEGKKEKDTGPQPDQYLIESKLKTELSKDSIVQIARISELPGIEKQIKSNVKIYEITYKTKNFDGTDIVASGIVLIPDVSQAASMVSIQHGTALSDQDVPTTFAAYAEPALVGPLFAGQGYITVMADYIGYGSSKAVPHPYEHRASLGSSVVTRR